MEKPSKITLIFGKKMCSACQEAKAKAEADFQSIGKKYRYLSLDDESLYGPGGAGILAVAASFGIVPKDGSLMLPQIIETDEGILGFLD